jgi:hypothetical protein
MTKSKKRPMLDHATTALASEDTSTVMPPPSVESGVGTVPDAPQSSVELGSPPLVAIKVKAPARRRKVASSHDLSTSSSSQSTAASTEPTATVPTTIANIILHLKCSLKDLEDNKQHLRTSLTYDPAVPPTICAYNMEKSDLRAVRVDTTEPLQDAAYNMDMLNSKNNRSMCECCLREESREETHVSSPPSVPSNVSISTLHHKMKKLKTLLFKNIPVTDKKSACFWCTYPFDTPECHIPFYNMNGQVHGYGVFCRPECAVGHLMKESLDDSTKFERYHLLNQMYGKVFGYKKNIKPAPNPYYMLERYCGNLSIEEYRAMLQSNHVLYVIDKPMTRTLPELHEETEEVITSLYETGQGFKVYGSAKGRGEGTKEEASHTTHVGGGVYKAKRQSESKAGTSKNNILMEHFGLTAPAPPMT